MPRFFFHIRHAATGVLDIDEDGLLLPDISAAETEAVAAAKELVVERIRSNQRIDSEFEVTGEDGCVIFVLPFQEAIRL